MILNIFSNISIFLIEGILADTLCHSIRENSDNEGMNPTPQHYRSGASVSCGI